jgi:hypothetical protein
MDGTREARRLAIADRMIAAGSQSCPEHDVMVRNVKAVYWSAPAHIIEQAEVWLPDVTELIQTLSNRWGFPYGNIAGLVSAGTTAAHWETQALTISSQVAWLAQGGDIMGMPGRPLTGSQRQIMASCLFNGPSAIKSPKWSDMLRLLMGDKRVICVDRHFYDITNGFRGKYRDAQMTAGEYECRRAAGIDAADSIGVDPSYLHIRCWLWQRELAHQLSYVCKHYSSFTYGSAPVDPSYAGFLPADGSSDYV